MVKKIGKAVSYLFFAVAIMLGSIALYAFVTLNYCKSDYCTNYLTISGGMALMLGAIIAIAGFIIKHYLLKK